MVRIRKPLKYATFFKASKEILNDPDYKKYIFGLSRLPNLPKNTLMVTKLKTEIGLHNDDFVKDQRTVRTTYRIYTFKRI